MIDITHLTTAKVIRDEMYDGRFVILNKEGFPASEDQQESFYRTVEKIPEIVQYLQMFHDQIESGGGFIYKGLHELLENL